MEACATWLHVAHPKLNQKQTLVGTLIKNILNPNPPSHPSPPLKKQKTKTVSASHFFNPPHYESPILSVQKAPFIPKRRNFWRISEGGMNHFCIRRIFIFVHFEGSFRDFWANGILNDHRDWSCFCTAQPRGNFLRNTELHFLANRELHKNTAGIFTYCHYWTMQWQIWCKCFFRQVRITALLVGT